MIVTIIMILIKTKKEIEIMAENGRILAEIMERIKKEAKPGIATNELNRLAEELIFKFKGEPSFKGYDGFPCALCVSINEEIVHGAPSDRKLKQGDIVSLDLGFFKNGFHSDMATTLPVGEIAPEARRLIRVTKKTLKLAIKKSRPGNTFGDIGNLIQRYAESQNYGVVRELCGHGIGKDLHEDPQILNYGKRHKGEEIKQGMVICIEPMLTLGSGEIERTKDGFGFRTEDNSISAHFEHTIAITGKGPNILTKV